MPLQGTSGAASQDAFGGYGVAVVPNYIEEVFSTYLYTGNSTSQTITNGIDLSTNGGLVWFKNRTAGSTGQMWYDTARGAYKAIQSDNTGAEANYSPDGLSAFSTSGFSVNGASDYWNSSNDKFASWTFRKQPKFFDIVTWTGDGTGERVINHSLSVAPTVIIYKRTSTTGPWSYSQWDGTESKWLRLNETGASSTSNLVGGYISPEPSVGAATPTSITLLGNSGVTQVNTTGATYVAYLFAHNAGGFGLSGTDNVISCGTFTTDGAGAATVTLGYEPQWVMTKSSSGTSAWRMFDTMRRLTVAGQNDALLQAQSSAAEITNSDYCSPTATGFTIDGHTGSETHIYIAIRRGPMKVPTSGTSVFTPAIRTGTGTTTTVTGVGFPLDVVLSSSRNYPAYGGYLGQFWDRLRGAGRALRTPETAAEVTVTNAGVLGQDGYTVSASSGGQNDSSDPFVDYSFRRAPSFFDEVCYTGTGSATTFAHNLGAVPELMITKCRGDAFGWAVYSSPVGNTAALFLETTAIPDTNTAYWNNTTPTSTVFSVGSASRTNRTSLGMVAYLFATCAGVSKVGSYTGNGTTQTIDCGFTGGARFVLIKRTDSTGDWYVYDTARGMTTLTDPYLLLNNTAAEAATLGSVTTVSTGFALNSTILAAINVSAGTYIFLAIA